ncbi:hypothetical protein RRSWK_00122 [Rhodopirellula sp. SWK7]|nr:hypothetical protein RRSWK_00122 [Rhodopirellula sp. SWK7]
MVDVASDVGCAIVAAGIRLHASSSAPVGDVVSDVAQVASCAGSFWKDFEKYFCGVLRVYMASPKIRSAIGLDTPPCDLLIPSSAASCTFWRVVSRGTA